MFDCKPLFGAALVLMSAAPKIPAQELTIRVRLKAQEQVFLLLAAGPGPGLQFPGVTGTLRLDLATLMVFPGAPANQYGISATVVPGLLGLPPSLVHCQALTFSAGGLFVSKVFQPLEDRAAEDAERQLPALGPAGPAGPYLFGLTEQQILATARRYAQRPVDEARLLHDMRRPFHRAKEARLVADVGMVDAADVIRQTWQGLLAGAPIQDVFRTAVMRHQALAEARFEARYPSGIPDDDEHWDGASSPSLASSCARDVIVATGSTVGDYRLRIEANHTDFGYSGAFGLAYGYGTSTSYKKYIIVGWEKKKADYIRISGTLTTDLQTNTFFQSDYDAKSVSDNVGAWYTSSNGSVTVEGRADWGSTTLTGSACDT